VSRIELGITLMLNKKTSLSPGILYLVVLTFGMSVIVAGALQQFDVFILTIACIALGFFVGFLFGLPRVVQKERDTNGVMAASSDQKDNGSSRLLFNTNLEKVSDFITTSIISLSLANLQNFPSFFSSAVNFVASGIDHSVNDGNIQPAHSAKLIAASILIYFVTTGFLYGYIVTQTRIAREFRRFFDEPRRADPLEDHSKH